MNWKGFQNFYCREDIGDGLTVLGTEGGLKTLVASCNSDPFSFKMVFVEPLSTKGPNQVQEFLDFNGGPGVQHIALHTETILATVSKLKRQGVETIEVPLSYYESLLSEALSLSSSFSSENNLEEKVISSDSICNDEWFSWAYKDFLSEDRLVQLKSLGILVDISLGDTEYELQPSHSERPLKATATATTTTTTTTTNGRQHSSTDRRPFLYLLQTFTTPLQDRPTFFLEFISRVGSSGFGRRSIQALFEAVERQQQKQRDHSSSPLVVR